MVFKGQSKYFRLNKWNICSTNYYKTYENLKFTILKFSNACQKNERKRGLFVAEKKREVLVEKWTQILS